MTHITPNEHEKREWSRLAQAAYGRLLNSIGHRYSGAAAMRSDQHMTVEQFDQLQTGYREWLLNGFSGSAAAYINQHCT